LEQRTVLSAVLPVHDTVGLYLSSESLFLERNSNAAGLADQAFQFGARGEGYVPLAGDWNGDGVDTVGLYSGATGVFLLRDVNAAGNAERLFTYGARGQGYHPIAGDWDGDGDDSVGLFSPEHGVFFLRNSNSAGAADLQVRYGAAGEGLLPLVGDWDGAEADTIGVYQRANGLFFLRNSNSAGLADLVFQYGAGGPDLLPLVGNWDADTNDGVGVYRVSDGAFMLRNESSPGVADLKFFYGAGGDTRLPLVGAWESPATVSDAVHDNHGFLVHTVRSPFQADETQIRVLLPDEIRPGERYPVIYVLPVERLNGNAFGNGLREAQSRHLHNTHQAIFVEPTFSRLPWYADHPTDLSLRQEGYLLNVVVRFIETAYPARTEPEGRLLLGFSKSGWGAWSLLLRHPDIFGRAAAWDAPLMMERLGQYDTTPIFGTQENFERYRISDLLRMRAEDLRQDARLILTGYTNFRQHHDRIHALMLSLNIPHEYRDGPRRNHDWHSGWLPEAVELLLK